MTKNQKSHEPKSELRRAYDYPSRAGIWFLIGDIVCAAFHYLAKRFKGRTE